MPNRIIKESICTSDSLAGLDRLRDAGIIELYTVHGRPYLLLKTWQSHQRVRNSRRKFPPPEEADGGALRQDAADCRLNPIQSESQSENQSVSLSEDNPETGSAGRRFKAPSVQEIEDYCQKRGGGVDGKKFWEYYDAAGWVDGKGNPVRSWKQKVISWEGRRGGQAAAVSEKKEQAAPSFSEMRRMERLLEQVRGGDEK